MASEHTTHEVRVDIGDAHVHPYSTFPVYQGYTWSDLGRLGTGVRCGLCGWWAGIWTGDTAEGLVTKHCFQECAHGE